MESRRIWRWYWKWKGKCFFSKKNFLPHIQLHTFNKLHARIEWAKEIPLHSLTHSQTLLVMERDQPLARQHERDNRSIRQNASNVRVRALNMSKADHYSPPKYTLTHIHVPFGGYIISFTVFILCAVCCTRNIALKTTLSTTTTTTDITFKQFTILKKIRLFWKFVDTFFVGYFLALVCFISQICIWTCFHH